MIFFLYNDDGLVSPVWSFCWFFYKCVFLKRPKTFSAVPETEKTNINHLKYWFSLQINVVEINQCFVIHKCILLQCTRVFKTIYIVNPPQIWIKTQVTISCKQCRSCVTTQTLFSRTCHLCLNSNLWWTKHVNIANNISSVPPYLSVQPILYEERKKNCNFVWLWQTLKNNDKIKLKICLQHKNRIRKAIILFNNIKNNIN